MYPVMSSLARADNVFSVQCLSRPSWDTQLNRTHEAALGWNLIVCHILGTLTVYSIQLWRIAYKVCGTRMEEI